MRTRAHYVYEHNTHTKERDSAAPTAADGWRHVSTKRRGTDGEGRTKNGPFPSRYPVGERVRVGGDVGGYGGGGGDGGRYGGGDGGGYGLTAWNATSAIPRASGGGGVRPTDRPVYRPFAAAAAVAVSAATIIIVLYRVCSRIEIRNRIQTKTPSSRRHSTRRTL